MYNTLMREMRAWLLRPTVVHRLPGRLRLRISAIKRLPPEHRDLAMLWREILESAEPIEAVDVNTTTGSVLVRYDQAVMDEGQVLASLASVNRFLLRQWDRLIALSPGKLPEVLLRMQAETQDALRERPVLSEDFEVSDDVWA